MNRKKVLVVCAALAIFAVAIWTHGSGGLSLKREFEIVYANVQTPTVIVRLTDGNYVVAGKGLRAVADKVDEKGNTLWEYQAPTVFAKIERNGDTVWQNPAPDQVNAPKSVGVYRFIESGFYGAVAADDGGVLLCGYLFDHPTTKSSGIVVRLDKYGHEVNRMLYYEYFSSDGADDKVSTELDTCGRLGNGFVVLGRADHYGPNHKPSGGYLLMRLHDDGSVESQKLIIVDGAPGISRPQLMPDGGLSFTIGWKAIRLDENGDLVASKELEATCQQAFRIGPPDDSIRFVCNQAGAPGFQRTQIVDLGANLQIKSTRNYPPSNVSMRGGAASFPDGSLILFGSKGSLLTLTADVPTALEYAPDGTISSSYKFRLPWVNGWFVDAIPGEKPNEVVGLRWTTGDSRGRTFVDVLAR